MFKPLSVFLATRYSTSRQVGGFAAFISASSTIGIALGVMVLIVVLSAMNGFERALADKLLSIVPHGEIVAVEQPIDNWQQRLPQIIKQPQVIASAPVISLTGMLQYKTGLKSIEVRGVDPVQELNVSGIADYIKQGSWQVLSTNSSEQQYPQVIIGQGVAKKLGVEIGQRVQLLIPPNSKQLSLSKKFPTPKKYTFEVGAIFKFGGVIDDTLAYISLSQAQKIKGYSSSQVQGFRLLVNDVFDAPQITRNVAYSFDHYVYILDWTRTQGHLFNDIQLVRMVMTLVMVLVIAVASFNIVSTLIMVVNEKQSDIAILKTMGASSLSIMLTFVLQGLVNGVLGCLSGAVLGVLLAENLTEVIVAIETAFNVKFLSSDVYFIDYLPTALNYQDVYVTVGIALVLSVLATLYPSWRATKVEPAVVLGQA